ncbi:DinB family protein [Micromonospora sp. U56]|uniref:DinB family protein n=1 Tax=Micromonospora sp. U56 TaxID=2824900 RepID=UPI001B3668BB|nr:DinB family protein [Micromonospora sp. U56]MBQ0892675.1 DinB family protein [Micromonospora sp. U56]
MSQHVPVTAAAHGRRIPAHQLGDKEMLWAFLRFARATVVAKTDGLSTEQLSQSHVSSATTLGGIVKHLVTSENHWFGNVLGGLGLPMPFSPADPDADWRIEDGEGTASLVAAYRAACEISDQVITSLALDSTGTGTQTDDDYTLRWALTHLIAETNRHAGHADLLRELTDGVRSW